MSRLITADASRISGAEFFEAVFGKRDPWERDFRRRMAAARIAKDQAAIDALHEEAWERTLAQFQRKSPEPLVEVVRDTDPQTGNERAAA